MRFVGRGARFSQTFILSSALLIGLTACGSDESESENTEWANEKEYLSYLSEQYADFYQIENPPHIEPVRFVDTDERQVAQDECLKEAGYETHPDGGWTVPEGQDEAFNLASYTCEMQYPTPIEYAREWSSEQAEVQYRWTTDFLIPCLSDEGYTVGEPPSLGTFVDTWDTKPYRPFEEIESQVPTENFNNEWARLNQACPQEAPGSLLFGDESLDEWVQRTGR